MVDFLKYRWLYILISSFVIGVGLFSIINWGFHSSIDFVGGTNLEYLLNKQINLKDFKKLSVIIK